MFTTFEDPTTDDEDVKDEKCSKAMSYEIDAIERNRNWHLTSLPVGSKKIGAKWVYKTKVKEKREV